MKIRDAFSVATLLVLSVAVSQGDEPTARGGDADHHFLARPDAFKTLVNPNCSHCVDEAKSRAKDLRDDDRVLAWIRGQYDGGAIPLRFFLAPYRVISDTYGVFVYDPDAGFVRGYEPSLDFTFHGWRNGVMVMRHKDGTLFSTLSGRAFDGPRKGERLTPIATLETNWGHWLAGYPGTVAYRMFEKYQPIELPKKVNADSVSTRLDWGPSAVSPELPVIGVEAGEASAAYALEYLAKSGGVVASKIGEQPVVVLWYGPTNTAAAYAPEVEGSSPTQQVTLAKDDKLPAAPFVDRETGSHWDIASRAVDGPLKGKTLRWLPSVQCRWFAWRAEFPQARLHMSPKEPGGKAVSQAVPLTPDPSPTKGRGEIVPVTPSPSRTKGRGEIVPLTQSAPAEGRGEIARRTQPAPTSGKDAMRGVIVAPGDVTDRSAADWAKQGFRMVVVTLDDAATPDRQAQRRIARSIAGASLDLYYWIEVARCPRMADEHPQWMASLGMHDDWHERFPNAPLPKSGEVAKAWPWVPIGYRESFDAHRARIERLLAAADPSYRGVLLNDLQGGPASCGCGNLQCRWAIDYRVPSTATKLDGPDTAAKFIAEIRKLAPGKPIIPVWTTECEDVDLPAALAPGGKTTGLCGGVPCANGTCPKAFAQQWSALLRDRDGPIGLLALDGELDRRPSPRGAGGDFVAQAVRYLDKVAVANKAPAIAHDRLWAIVQGYGASAEEAAAATQRAGQTAAGTVLVALTRIDQTYQPRIVVVK